MILPILIVVILLAGGLAGYREKSLTASGAIAAVFVGLAIYAGFGIKGLVILGVFFVSSSFWSKYKSYAKRELEEKLAKGSTRDWRQVIANGGMAALFSICYYFHPGESWVIGFIVSLASSNSDTWASEIGSLSRKEPIFIRTFKRVEKGTSGAVSLLGSLAALIGSLIIALVSFWLFQLSLVNVMLVFLFGYIGNVIDTLFGAFYQQAYVCKQCGIETEKRNHCGLPTSRIKGISLVDNDMVNFLSGLLAAAIAIFTAQML